MMANPILLQMKYTRIVKFFAERNNMSLGDALAFFYHSELYQLVQHGISDMHCMSDSYLVEELEMEYDGNNKQGY